MRALLLLLAALLTTGPLTAQTVQRNIGRELRWLTGCYAYYLNVSPAVVQTINIRVLPKDGKNLAWTAVDLRYLTATIGYNMSKAAGLDWSYLQRLAAHEVAHILVWPIDEKADDVRLSEQFATLVEYMPWIEKVCTWREYLGTR